MWWSHRSSPLHGFRPADVSLHSHVTCAESAASLGVSCSFCRGSGDITGWTHSASRGLGVGGVSALSAPISWSHHRHIRLFSVLTVCSFLTMIILQKSEVRHKQTTDMFLNPSALPFKTLYNTVFSNKMSQNKKKHTVTWHSFGRAIVSN